MTTPDEDPAKEPGETPGIIGGFVTDKLTARVLGGLLLVFPFVMGGATLFVTPVWLRSTKLVLGILITTLPLWVAGALMIRHARKLRE